MNKRKATTVKSLFAVGESRWAMDFRDAAGPDAYQTLENIMRAALKSGGQFRTVKWTKAIANAILECQTIPAIERQQAEVAR